ncbi:competence protein ComQ [Oikeobacillus pervagus]|uniref:Competence protein ComQ n=1 Tax=Oikeobacillus pervagus TaxID=1325931 RepID=A0AAJ1T143_9BACI|nr:polyprenyl synthetase family protein [Oikeobacillus pervagus]MDQ0216374.1 competence protein ComQ [Oikeobacillus pervagus]
MKPLLEDQLHQHIVDQANVLIDRYFFEKDLKFNVMNYVNHKFDQIINFSQFTKIHYDIFRDSYNKEEEINLLTIVELIILASDIMDDIQDGDAGDNPWADVDLGQNLNIIVGMLFLCLKHLDEMNIPDFMKEKIRSEIHLATLGSINGQHIDLSNNISSESEYLSMVSLKSGSLVQLACLLGAGCVDENTERIIKTYSRQIGIIAQIRNDVNDMVNGFIKSDIINKKKTLPILYYLKLQKPQFQIVKEYYLGNQPYSELTREEISDLHNTLIYGGAVEYCKVMEQLYLHKYKECIHSLNIGSSDKEKLLHINI